MRGDWVQVVVDTGDSVQTFEIAATRAGRRVEVASTRGGVIEVTEVTRRGNAVRTARFMASRVVALVEHPAESEDTTGGSPRRRRRAPSNQQSLL
jgi:hypothetical protein